MDLLFLCDICNGANGNAFPSGKCHVCGGAAMRLAEMIESAAQLLSLEKGAGRFSISTIIPKEWISREEDVWDIRLAGPAESVKNYINRTIVAALRRKTGLGYESEGDCRIVFDFSSGKVTRLLNEIFIFGRYRKLVTGLSQSRWRCAGCQGKGCGRCNGKGKNYESVEERIGEPAKKAADSEDYVLHASGREDVDATNSAGRAFVLELKNPKNRKPNLVALREEIRAGGEVSVDSLRIVERSFAEIVTESHFDKTYRAEIETGRALTEADRSDVKGLEGKILLQQTPKRVAHRRADLVRHRKIKHIEMNDPKDNHAILKVKAEAGTYIKELISGDEGRTKPSIAEILGTTAACTRLDVAKIDDGFLDFCLEERR